MDRFTRLGNGLPAVCRLGLATRGNTSLDPDDVHHAVERGVNYLNWCAKPDGLSRAVAQMEPARRQQVVVAAQFKARTAAEAEREFDGLLQELGGKRLDVATLYYVESDEEWRTILAPDGAWHVLNRRKELGELGLLGLTSHQRKLAARWASEPGLLDLLMIRYNAAHRGAEQDVFAFTRDTQTPVVSFTGVRWSDLLRSTPEDPPGFVPPSAAECYRFCLANPAIGVTLMAPNGRDQLDANLSLLENWSAPGDAWLESMRAHGDRVHRHAREFW